MNLPPQNIPRNLKITPAIPFNYPYRWIWVADRARAYMDIFAKTTDKQGNAGIQLQFITAQVNGQSPDVWMRLARANAVLSYYSGDMSACEKAELRAAIDFKETGQGGEMMELAMLGNMLRARRPISRDGHAAAEFECVQIFMRASDKNQILRSYAVQLAKAGMNGQRQGDYWFEYGRICAAHSAQLGDTAEAENLYEKLSRHRTRGWSALLDLGQLRERNGQLTQALSDYDMAFQRAGAWNEVYTCAQRIVDLCVNSGKLPNTAHAKKVVNELYKRAVNQDQRKSATQLLEGKK